MTQLDDFFNKKKKQTIEADKIEWTRMAKKKRFVCLNTYVQIWISIRNKKEPKINHITKYLDKR